MAIAMTIGRGTVRKPPKSAVGHNSIVLPIAAGVFFSTFGLALRPEIAH